MHITVQLYVEKVSPMFPHFLSKIVVFEMCGFPIVSPFQLETERIFKQKLGSTCNYEYMIKCRFSL